MYKGVFEIKMVLIVLIFRLQGRTKDDGLLRQEMAGNVLSVALSFSFLSFIILLLFSTLCDMRINFIDNIHGYSNRRESNIHILLHVIIGSSF